MRVGLEGRVLSPRIGGIGRYAIRLVEALVALSVQESPDLELVIFTAPQTDRSPLRGVPATVCERFGRIKSTLLRSSVLLPVGAILDDIDLFHGLDQSGIPLFFKTRKSVVTIHDVIPLVLPWAFTRRHRWVLSAALARVRRQADVVIVPSAAAADDVGRYLRIDRRRITVIPMGCDARFHPGVNAARMLQLRRRYALPERYVLFVGTLEPRKNITLLLQAFSRLLAERPQDDVRLVVAGGKGWGDRDPVATAEALNLRPRVIFTGFIEDDDLPDLYRGAQMFVYPSLYEGFGLPVVEAMACGTPVITSNRASLPEVAGDAALLIDPTRPDDLAAAMSALMSGGALHEELRWKGLARAKEFTWEAVARKTLEVYRAVCAV
jgi:glycosyltransferase involved in cell wall biosynthesis